VHKQTTPHEKYANIALLFRRIILKVTFLLFETFYSSDSKMLLLSKLGVMNIVATILTVNIIPKEKNVQKYPMAEKRKPPITGPIISPIPVAASAYPKYFSLLSAKTNVIIA
jgi:hypothetical protein